MFILILSCIFVSVQGLGNVDAVYQLLERVIPGSSKHFSLSLADSCSGTACFVLEDTSDDRISVTGTGVSELTAGIGAYLREWCNITVGWPRGGGSNVFLPSPWPRLGSKVVQKRIVPWSYIMNVCTHSYSLVWYSWEQWSAFIDWMALSGINMALALTGQEEVQYKVFSQLGLNDTEIRTWFNGPAFLTWSRGQNEYGNNIAGPLPRSWMKAQWNLQKLILARYRSLGITGQLPAFQGNVPWALAQVLGDHNMTRQGDTGWMDSLDPFFGKIADLWMKQLLEDFGTDGWYQMDGYFNGGTAPWLIEEDEEEGPSSSNAIASNDATSFSSVPACKWANASDSYLAGCFQNCKQFQTVAEAQAHCLKYIDCGGVTVPRKGLPQLREGTNPLHSPDGETSYYISNDLECHVIAPDPLWQKRGAAAYAGITRTDPHGTWSYQGWAIIDWNNARQASSFSGFVSAVPKGKFVVVGMSVNGDGEWKNFNRAAYYGAPFIWTTLHDFGGTDGMKGDLRVINRIPFDGLPPLANNTSVWGTGYTPEGIDQNPVYYEFMAQANWRDKPVADIPNHISLRSHKRYGLKHYAPSIAAIWANLVAGAYSQDLSVQDGTGVPHLPGYDMRQWHPNRYTPRAVLCATFKAWKPLIDASQFIDEKLETYSYDLVNLGREILAQLSTPMSLNFTDAIHEAKLDEKKIAYAGALYMELLNDIDTLVGTDRAFLLGQWIEWAKFWAGNNDDCGEKSCPAFYEWNARVQLTTWNPTPKNANAVPPGPVDYASKHWNGLIKDYYAARVDGVAGLAIAAARAGKPLDNAAVEKFEATLAYQWTNDNKSYPISPVGDFVAVSQGMYGKYAKYFSSCE